MFHTESEGERGTGSGVGRERMNLKRPTPRYIIIKMAKVKDTEMIPKEVRKHSVQGNPHKAIS